ncbi:MAG: CBS domain-containing protein [Thiobacillaceae bacterium]|jgi:CBS-domain-containing membrane protein
MTANQYSPIKSTQLQKGIPLHRVEKLYSDNVGLDDPAIRVMTDLRKISAITIRPEISIEIATQRMKQRGVRMLLVTDDSEDIVGLITSTDLQGEKPLLLVQQMVVRYRDILVRDIMTPHDQLEVLCMDDVEKATVGDVVATLQRAGRQHALVADRVMGTQEQSLRGIFSAAQVARQLDMEIIGSQVDDTFAQIERLIRA